jgi:Tfp pilus assembly protein PilF
LKVNQDTATPEERVQLGELRLRAGDVLQAGELALSARKADPSLPQAHNLLGVIYTQVGQPDKARGHFLTAVKVAPKQLAPRLSLARFELEQRRPKDALRQLEEALKIDPKNGELWLLAGRVQRALHSDSNAETSFRKAITLDPDLGEAYFELGTVELDFDHYKEAVPHFEKAYGLGLRTPQLLSCYALALAAGPADDASFARAEQLLTEAGRPEAPPSWFAQGLVLQRKKELPGAIQAFQKVLKVNPRNERAQYALAMTYRDKKDLAAAQKAFARHDQLVRERQRKQHSSSKAPSPGP